MTSHKQMIPPALLVWRDDWNLGIQQLDEDHKAIVELLNRLICTSRSIGVESSTGSINLSGPEARARCQCEGLKTLIDYLRGHFAREEALMRAIDYPDFQAHAREHAIQLAELADLQRNLSGSNGVALTEEALLSIKRSCFDHLISDDQLLALSQGREMDS